MKTKNCTAKLVPHCAVCRGGIKDDVFVDVWQSDRFDWPNFFAHKACVDVALALFRKQQLLAKQGVGTMPRKDLLKLLRIAGWKKIREAAGLRVLAPPASWIKVKWEKVKP